MSAGTRPTQGMIEAFSQAWSEHVEQTHREGGPGAVEAGLKAALALTPEPDASRLRGTQDALGATALALRIERERNRELRDTIQRLRDERRR